MTCPDDYNVVFVAFPGDVLAAVRVDSDGYPTIYINWFLSDSARRAALDHELSHIERGDLTNHLTIYDVERSAAASVPLPALMTRSFRDLAEEETWRLLFAGVTLFANAFDDPPRFTIPMEMPEPLFDGDPMPNRFVNVR